MRETSLKHTLFVGTLMAATLALAACSTEVRTVPLQGALAQPGTLEAAPGAPLHRGAGPVTTSADPSNVAVYFGTQTHPAVQKQLGDVSYSVRIARGTNDGDRACRNALGEALRKLRAGARDHAANAVINVTTRFHSTVTDSDNDFTCGLSSSAAAIAVHGDFVVLETNQ